MRRTGHWEASDEIRKKLMTMGIEISDTPEGMTWRLKNKNIMDG
jgi:cysteinyl-tRNA synthetase